MQVALGPLFSTMLSLNLLNTKLGLMLPYLAFGVSYQVFILYGFFKAIPRSSTRPPGSTAPATGGCSGR